MLRLGDGIELPVQAVTEKIGVFGISGSGKTNTAGVLVEEMFAAGQHVVVCDPLGVCWGLRSSMDGTSEGLPLVVFGGKRADIPLSAENGKEIADLVVGMRLSCILDLSEFDIGEMAQFMAAFVRELLKRNAEPLHLVFDEAQLFAPQVPEKRVQPLLSAMERLTLTGRVCGLGMTFISQRPTLVSKNVVSQMGLLISHKISHVADQKTLLDWAKPKTTPAKLAEMAGMLALQKKGWAWIVGEMDDLHLVQEAQIRLRRTFDSSATPKIGQAVRAPQTMATVDLSQLRDRLTGGGEPGDDPEALRSQIARLQAQVAGLQSAPKVERIEVPVLRPEDLARIESVCDSVIAIGKDQVAQGQELLALGRGIQETLAARKEVSQQAISPQRHEEHEVSRREEENPQITQISQIRGTAETVKREATPAVTVIKARVPAGGQALASLNGGARHLIQTLAEAWPGKLTLKQWGTLAKREPSGGAFQESMRALLDAGLITRDGGFFRLSAAGCKAFGLNPSPAPTSTAEALKLWERALRPREMQILRKLVEIAPKGMSREAIASWLGLEVSGGGFQSYLLTLRQNDLIVQQGRLLHKHPRL